MPYADVGRNVCFCGLSKESMDDGIFALQAVFATWAPGHDHDMERIICTRPHEVWIGYAGAKKLRPNRS